MNDIVNGKRGVTPDTALRLAGYFGNSPEFWLNLRRHLFRIAFTVLVLFFVYRSGEALAHHLRRLIHERVGDRGNHCIELAIRRLRATIGGTLVVGIFDGVLIGIVCAIARLPDAHVWGALAGLLAAIPFLGYVVVFGAFVTLLGGGSAIAAWAVLAAGAVILFTGDKVVRPILVSNSTQLVLRVTAIAKACLFGKSAKAKCRNVEQGGNAIFTGVRMCGRHATIQLVSM